MPIRLSGMASGLDTDTIVKGLVDAQKLKNKKVSDKSQVLDWKQERLKELNTKLYKLYSEDLTKLRLQSAYGTKKATSSNENLVTVTGNSNAPVGEAEVIIKQLASSQSIIGKTLDKDNKGNNVTAGTKLVDLGIADGTLINIETKDGKKTLDVNNSTTLSSFLDKCKEAGLNASYDTAQKRIFLSAKNSGEDNWFTVTTSEDNTLENKRGIDTAVGYSKLNSTDKAKVDAAYKTLEKADKAKIAEALKSTEISENDDTDTRQIKIAVADIINLAETNLRNVYTNEAKSIATSISREAIKNAIETGGKYPDDVDYTGVKATFETKAEEDLKRKYGDSVNLSEEKYVKEKEALVERYINSRIASDLKSEAVTAKIAAKETEIIGSGIQDKIDNVDISIKPLEERITDGLTKLKSDIELYYPISSEAGNTSNILSKLGLTEITRVGSTDEFGKTTYQIQVNDKDVQLKSPTNSIISYNGLEVIGNSNTVSVNGLTLTLKGITDEKIILNTTNDTQSTFDTIKKFVTNYNAILKELNTLYYAESARGYDPLSDEEKEAMTEAQIEKWETKIKDSSLRRDSEVGNIINVLKTSLSKSVVASDGNKYSLASFGIVTSDYTEKGLLHISGDPDDAAFSTATNKLMNALESDPDIVAEVLSKTIGNLYKDVNENIKAIPNVRSAFTFYNDKLMATQQTEYKKKIAVLESKLITLENKYYKQFSAMEKAMSKLQSQSNALAGMLGTNTN